MTEESSDAEQKELQDLVQRIATHIVEGSSAVQELRGMVAKLKNQRSDLEFIVAQNWLAASKIIQEAGKNITSWENFINALRITYTDDLETSNPKLSKEYDEVLRKSSEELWKQEITTHEKSTIKGETTISKEYDEVLRKSSEELWKQEITTHEKSTIKGETSISPEITIHGESFHPTPNSLHPYEPSTEFNVLEYNVSNSTLHPQTDSEVALLTERNSLFDKSGCNDGIGETLPTMQVPLTTGEPSNYKPPNNNKKRPLNSVIPNDFGGERGRPKPRIQFSNGRELDREHFLALKKSGRCYFCEGVGHRALDCPENPDKMKFADQRFIYQGMDQRASNYPENPDHMQFADQRFFCEGVGHRAFDCPENPDNMKFADQRFIYQGMDQRASDHPENPDHMQFADQRFFCEGGPRASDFPETPDYMMFPDHRPFGGWNS